METAVALAIVGLFGSILGSMLTAFSKKWRTPADAREDKALVLTDKDKVLQAQDRLVERFEKLLKESDDRHSKEIAESDARHSKELGDVAAKVTALEGQIKVMQGEKSRFVACIQHLVRVVRKYGHEDEIGELPPEVYV